jgi:hypothetical protein
VEARACRVRARALGRPARAVRRLGGRTWLARLRAAGTRLAPARRRHAPWPACVTDAVSRAANVSEPTPIRECAATLIGLLAPLLPVAKVDGYADPRAACVAIARDRSCSPQAAAQGTRLPVSRHCHCSASCCQQAAKRRRPQAGRDRRGERTAARAGGAAARRGAGRLRRRPHCRRRAPRRTPHAPPAP